MPAMRISWKRGVQHQSMHIGLQVPGHGTNMACNGGGVSVRVGVKRNKDLKGHGSLLSIMGRSAGRDLFKR
jgi:hypothetical protein